MQKSKSRLVPVIAFTGFFAGMLDITAALLHYYIVTQKNPLRVFQYISSSIYGPSAYSGNFNMILAGVIIHFFIAYFFTTIFFLVYPHLKLNRLSPFLVAIIYGILIWLTMNMLVLPLTKVALPKNFEARQVMIGILILICAIGLPVSLAAKKFYSKKSI